MVRYQNIALCQIDVKTGKTDYFLPKNANWRGKKIEKIVVYCPLGSGSILTSPVNGEPISAMADLADLYFDLYNEEGVNVMHNVQAYLLTADNNFPLEIKEKLSFDLSRVYFTQAPQSDFSLMLYIFYNETEALVDEPTENITVNFPLQAGERISFEEVIEKYMYARSKNVRYISVWNNPAQPVGYNTGFITLRSTDKKVAHEYIPCFMFRPCHQSGYPTQFLVSQNRIVLDIDIDFNNSFIVNTQSQADNYIITFYY